MKVGDVTAIIVFVHVLIGIELPSKMKDVSAIAILLIYLRAYTLYEQERRLSYNHTFCISMCIGILSAMKDVSAIHVFFIWLRA